VKHCITRFLVDQLSQIGDPNAELRRTKVADRAKVIDLPNSLQPRGIN
jgi:hypothetical protein